MKPESGSTITAEENGGNMTKKVQISQELFLDLVKYHLLDDTSTTRSKAISDALEDKLDKLVKHDTYSASKTAETAEERETARQRYLDMIDMPENFRY